MKRKSLWIGVAALVVALAAATGALALTRHGSTGVAAQTTFAAVRTSPPAQTAVPGACGALMNDPAAWKAMQSLRDEHLKDMQAWWKRYGSDPSSAAAQSALGKLRDEHVNDMRSLLGKYGAGTSGGRGAAVAPGYGYGMMGGATGGGYGMMGSD